jgi:hypothetical protein
MPKNIAQYANDLFALLGEAEDNGYKLVILEGGYVDLIDEKAQRRGIVWAAPMHKHDAYKDYEVA